MDIVAAKKIHEENYVERAWFPPVHLFFFSYPTFVFKAFQSFSGVVESNVF